MPGLLSGLFGQDTPIGGVLGTIGSFGTNIANSMDPHMRMYERELATQRQNQQALYNALQNVPNLPPGMAQAAAVNPQQFGPLIAPYLDQATKVQSSPNPLTGDQNFYAVTGGAHPSVSSIPVGGGAPGQGAGVTPTASDLFNQISAGRAQGASREDLLKLIPEGSGLRESVKSMLEGGVVPTNFSMRGAARDLALKIGHAVDENFNELEIPGRRKMYTDLNSSGQGSMGGILSNGKSALDHLANLGERFVKLAPANGPDIPGGGHIANVENFVGNALFPTAKTKGLISEAKDNLLKYGEESTKFYSATGGGEGERTYALKNLNPNTISGEEAAGYLRAERDLMDRRMAQKEQQVRNSLGQGYLDKHPIRDEEYNKTLGRIDNSIARLTGADAPKPTAPKAQLPNGWSVQVR